MAGGDQHRKNTANLRPPWPKGVSGNPAGRPRGKKLSEYLGDRLGEVEPRSGKTYGELVATALVVKCLKGDVPAIKEVLERLEGKVKERHEVAGFGGAPLVPQAAQQRMLADERVTELVCQLDEWLARPDDGGPGPGEG